MLDDFLNRFGPDAMDRKPERQPRERWHGICSCGHLQRYHSESAGGTYRLETERTQRIGGREVRITSAFFGCLGSLPPRDFEETTTTEIDRDAGTMVVRLNPTCGCESYREVAKVDRPNRYFNQRIPLDRTDPLRHPFQVGCRAMHTHITKLKAATDNPDFVREELSRRIVWADDRACDISRCKETDAWPQYVGDRSELRCAAHS